jgi:hypothetical protein
LSPARRIPRRRSAATTSEYRPRFRERRPPAAAEFAQLFRDLAQPAVSPHIGREQAGERAEAGQRSQFDDVTRAPWRPLADSARTRSLDNAVALVSQAGRGRAREVAAMRPEPQLMIVQWCCPIGMILGQIRTRAERDRGMLASFPPSRPVYR